MRTSTSFATLVAFMAVAGAAAPVGVSGSPGHVVVHTHDQRPRNVVPEHNLPDHVGVPDPSCEDCRDGTINKLSLDGAKPVVDTVKDVLDVDGKGAWIPKPDRSGEGLPPVQANVDVGCDPQNEHKTPDEQPHEQPHEHPHGERPHDNQGVEVEVKANVSKDHVDANVSVDVLKDGKPEVPHPDDTGKEVKNDLKGVHDQTVAGVKDGVHDGVQAGLGSAEKGIHGSGEKLDHTTEAAAQVAADLRKTPERVVGTGKDAGAQVVGDLHEQPIVAVGQKPKSDNPGDCEDLVSVDSRDGKPVVSTSAVRRFTSRILPRGWYA